MAKEVYMIQVIVTKKGVNMKNLSVSEKRALELMQKENFRGISKDNVMGLVSILDKIDPEVAIALIDQMPEAIRGMVEIEGCYASLIARTIDSNKSSVESCYASEDVIIETAALEASNTDFFEEKQYFFEQMVNAAVRKENKDTEHRKSNETLMKYGVYALLLGAGIVAGMFLGNTKIPTPKIPV